MSWASVVLALSRLGGSGCLSIVGCAAVPQVYLCLRVCVSDVARYHRWWRQVCQLKLGRSLAATSAKRHCSHPLHLRSAKSLGLGLGLTCVCRSNSWCFGSYGRGATHSVNDLAPKRVNCVDLRRRTAEPQYPLASEHA